MARTAAALLHVMTKSSAARHHTVMQALKEACAAAKLQQMLSWVAESPAIATTTAMLAEALPALAAVAQTDAEASHLQAGRGNLHEWAPVADALRRRLPRRMAARLLPLVDAVTAAVAGTPAAGQEDAAAQADAAMAALILVSADAGVHQRCFAPLDGAQCM